MWFPDEYLSLPVAGGGATVRTSETHPLEIDYLPANTLNLGPGRLGMTMLPGRQGSASDGGRWARSVIADVNTLRQQGVDTLVSLVEPWEWVLTHTESLLPTAAAEGIQTLWYPIPDHGVPPVLVTFDALLRTILRLLQRGRTVVLHCKAGHGRTGMTAAALLVATGTPADAAIAAIHAHREDSLTRGSQQEFVRAYERWLYPLRQPCPSNTPSASAVAMR